MLFHKIQKAVDKLIGQCYFFIAPTALEECDSRLMETTPNENCPDVKSVRFDVDVMVWEMFDGRIATVPLTHWPMLWLATKEERETMQIIRSSVWWPLLDEGLLGEHILRGDREHPRFARKSWERWMRRNYPETSACPTHP